MHRTLVLSYSSHLPYYHGRIDQAFSGYTLRPTDGDHRKRFGSAEFRQIRDKLGIESAKQGGDRIIEEGRVYLEQHLSTKEVKAWVQTKLARASKKSTSKKFKLGRKPESSDLECLKRMLIKIVSSIQQDSDKNVQTAVSTFISKVASAAVASGISGLTVTFGTATTGVAISALHGAAATTAKLYFIGSIFGLGVAGGAFVLGTGAIIAGASVGILSKRKIFGSRRSDADLQDYERAIVVACATLIGAIEKQQKDNQNAASKEKMRTLAEQQEIKQQKDNQDAASKEKMRTLAEQQEIKQQKDNQDAASKEEMRTLAEHALIPLAHQINQHWDESSLRKSKKSECQPFTKSLSLWHRYRLNQGRTELGMFAVSTMAGTD